MLFTLPRRQSRPAAFTLVEMLVVISIIAVLAALLLPAVQMARESGRRAQCSNNLRNLTLAIQQFDQAKGQYPASRTFWNDAAYRNTNIPTNWNIAAAPQATLTWVHEIMPYIEKQDMRTIVEATVAPGLRSAAPNVPAAAYGKIAIVFCPSDELDDATNAAVPQNYSQLSYGVNAGVPDNTSITPAVATLIGYDWAQNGVFDNRLKGSKDVQKTYKTTLGDVTNGNGDADLCVFVEHVTPNQHKFVHDFVMGERLANHNDTCFGRAT
jgi:prepilin-type N-terminal cleavage/methylation domain-containing protein